ncbi:elongator complex protein 6-like [Diadema antillarum]|uniref:elongator complex protein 6-like n=1 Tax=Diadema antillarum TaxID=105358 RepID=UPI003A8B7741
MFDELNLHLGCSSSSGSTSVPPKGNFFLVTEADDADASFLIHHFLSWYLKSGCKVIFLGLAQSFSHYSAVSQKLGVNLPAAKTSGQLEFISGLQYCIPLVKGSLLQEEREDCVLQDCIRSGSMNPLYNILRDSLTKETGAQPYSNVLVLIDDISILQSLGLDTRLISDFIQYCQWQGCLVTLLHCDTGQDEDEEMLYLSNRLQHTCSCHLRVEGLSSGFCKDVHGQLTIVQKLDHDPAESRKLLQFKVTDKNVSFFAAGTSSAVL